MKAIKIFFYIIFLFTIVHSSLSAQCPSGSTEALGADNTGWSSTALDAPSGSGVWQDTYTLRTIPDYVTPFCSAAIPPARITVSLVKVNYGFNIPCNATINQVDIIFYRRNNAAVGDVRDMEVFLRMPDHSPSSYNAAATTTPWLNSTSSFETYTYSHANWGEALTPDIVNDPRFGIQLRSQNNDPTNAATAEIDAIQMRVCYSVAGTPYSNITYSVALSGDDLCSPIQEGDITFSAMGGSGAYQYSIDGGTTWQSSNIFTNITQGNYDVSVKNADNTCITKSDIAYVGCNTGKMLQYGDAVITCKATFPTSPTLGIKPIQAFPQLYADGSVGYDISDSIPNSPYMWTYNQLGGDVFATTIDQNYNIYTGVTGLYDLSPSPMPVIPNLVKIDAVTGAVTILDVLPGTAGIGFLEWDTLCNQLYVVNMDDGKIYRYTGTGTLLDTFDPLAPDVTANGIAPLGERILGLDYNYVQGRLYYSVWKNDAINNGLRNEIRSVAISSCGFDIATDRLEIALPFQNEYGGGFAYSMPVADVEFSRDGTSLLLSEIGFNSLIPVGQPHESRILEYKFNGTTWALDTSNPSGNAVLKHEIGTLNTGKNSRGGIDFAYQNMDNGCTANPNAFIVATGDAFTGVSCEITGCYYGLQYWPVTGGNFESSVMMDIARTPLSQEKSIYGDVDVVSGCCPCAVYCPTITQPSDPISFCVGETSNNITVQTDQNAANSISFVVFASDQMSGTAPTTTEAAAIYGGTVIATVTPTYDLFPYTATYSFNTNDFPNTTDQVVTYYVYAILNPDLGATCRPLQEIAVKVFPKNSGIVWIDTNNNGVQDVNETAGLANVPVTAYWDDCAGNTGIVNTTTDSDGVYTLLGVPNGAKVRIEFDLPNGTYVQSVSGTDNQTETQFTTTPDCNIDLGVTQNPVLQIGNYVWHDADKDGIQDPCETPLQNVEVQLKQNGTLIGRTYTAADGTYYFGGNNNEGFTYETTTTSPQIFSASLTNTMDDARQNATGVANGAAGLLFNDRYLGLRFTNINIPDGAVITSANIRFTASTTGNIANVTIKGDTNIDAPVWDTGVSTYISNIFNSSATSNQVVWNNSNTWVVNDSGADQTTPDLSAIITELLGSPLWERDKTIAFVINAPANPTGATAFDLSGNATAGALLTINYVGTSQVTGGSLAPSTAYTICIPLDQTAIATPNFVPTLANSTLGEANDQNDSDGIKIGTTAVAVDIITPSSGSKFTYDFGFTSCALTANATGTNVSCNGNSDGTATVNINGNIAPVTYSWSNGGTTASISGLTAGTYTVTVTETATCTAVTSYDVTEPSALTVNCSSTDVTTNGGSDGTASVSASGGTSPYTYLWTDGETTSSINNKTAATYSVTVTDNNGCTDACTTTIQEPGCNLSVSPSGTNVSCNGGSDGTASVSASGNIVPVTYLWSNGGTTSSITGLTAGTYTVTVTETPTCTAVTNYDVTEPSALTVNCSSTDVTTNSGSDGTASVSASGGTSPYAYLWNSGETTSGISNKVAATYSVTVTDNNGCSDVCQRTIAEPGALPDLSLSKTVNTTTAALNGTVIFTLTLTNDNGIDATGVVVTDNLPAGVTFVSSSDPANVNVSGNILTWNVGNMLGTDAPKTLQITVTAVNEGSFVNTAEITAMNETDTDSTPNNDVAGEDDQDQACFSVPVKLCSDNASAMITITSGTATSWQWYVSTDNGASYTALSGENNQDLVINNTLMGGNGITKYFRVAYNGAAITDGCGATMCCPVIVTTETCTVCPMPKCIPITITKVTP